MLYVVHHPFLKVIFTRQVENFISRKTMGSFFLERTWDQSQQHNVLCRDFLGRIKSTKSCNHFDLNVAKNNISRSAQLFLYNVAWNEISNIVHIFYIKERKFLHSLRAILTNYAITVLSLVHTLIRQCMMSLLSLQPIYSSDVDVKLVHNHLYFMTL